MTKEKRVLVCGAGGFIGTHLVERLKREGCHVRGVDLKYPEFSQSQADVFEIGDLRSPAICEHVITDDLDEIYQLAADMGGAGYVFTGDNDAQIMHNSALINLNVLEEARLKGGPKIFYASSACIYPEYNQTDPDNPKCEEESAYPAAPDSEYGWEKLFSERLYLSYARNYGLDVAIGRYHNIFGPLGTWRGGREKAPAALCRKVCETQTGEIEVWGDGRQTRSFLYVDECVEGTLRLLRSGYGTPVNIGSDEMISINDLAKMIIEISGKDVAIKNVPGPEGVRGRNSDNHLILKTLGWAPTQPLRIGLSKTYGWIEEQSAVPKSLPHTADQMEPRPA